MLKTLRNILLLAGATCFLLLTVVTAAEATVVFFVEEEYDRFGREELVARLVEESERGLFYVDQSWWDELGDEEQEEAQDYLKILAYEFENNIWPILSKSYQWDWNVNSTSQKINILIHQMRGQAAGYFRAIDQYDRLQNPTSNQRQMVYLNTDHLTDYRSKSLLAHELMHLITFHKKEKVYQVKEETWLNEARAEYAPTLISYDRIYDGSNLQNRTRIFLENPSNSLVSWEEKVADYGALNLFTQYLVDHYGAEILIDSLSSDRVGISSLNEALAKHGYEKDFSQIYTDWTIAVLINDCSVGEDYCYHNQNLKDLRIIPKTNFLPLNGESALNATDQLQNWGAQWIRFIGGDGDLRLRFFGQSETLFRTPYVAVDRRGKTEVGFLDLNEYQNGEVNLANFGSNYYSLTIIPSIQSKQSGFIGTEDYYAFKWEAMMTPRNPEEKLIQELQAEIDYLQQTVVYLRSQIAIVLANQQGIRLNSFDRDLAYGLSQNEEVKALQLFLAIQEPEAYPEGLVTGHFYQLTRQAIIRFQEKYAAEVLQPAGLSKGTGYVGPLTRAKLNALLFMDHP